MTRIGDRRGWVGIWSETTQTVSWYDSRKTVNEQVVYRLRDDTKYVILNSSLMFPLWTVIVLLVAIHYICDSSSFIHHETLTRCPSELGKTSPVLSEGKFFHSEV